MEENEYEMELLRTLTSLILITEERQIKAGDHMQSFHAGEAAAYKLIYGIVRDAMD